MFSTPGFGAGVTGAAPGGFGTGSTLGAGSTFGASTFGAAQPGSMGAGGFGASAGQVGTSGVKFQHYQSSEQSTANAPATLQNYQTLTATPQFSSKSLEVSGFPPPEHACPGSGGSPRTASLVQSGVVH